MNNFDKLLKEFENYLRYKSKPSAEKTIIQYIRHVKQYEKWRQGFNEEPFTKLHRVEVIEYRNYDRIRNKNETTNRKMTALKTFNDYLIEEGIQEDLVVRNADRLAEEIKATSPAVTDVEDYLQLAHAARNSSKKFSYRNSAIVMLIVGTGIRNDECCNLHVTDVEFYTEGGDGSIRIRSGKRSKARTVRFGSRVRVELEEYLKKRNNMVPAAKDDPHLFVTRQKKKDGSYRITTKTIWMIFSEIRHKPEMTVHQARAVQATWLLEQDGITVADVAGALGNKVTSMDPYLRSNEKKLRKAQDGFGQMKMPKE